MAEEIIYCPSCNQKVRVPEELLGHPVQCPLCHRVFVAPVRGPSAAPPPSPPPMVQPAPPLSAPPPPPYLHVPPAEAEQEARAAAALIRPPAIALLLTGVIGWLVNAAALLMWRMVGPEGVAQQFERALQMWLPPGEQRDRLMAQVTAPDAYSQAMMQGLIFLGLCTAIIIGAVQMLQRRTYGLAVLASLLAMVNCQGLCCLLGAPFGIWSLSVLLRPEVRRAFE